jgi:hypothetical protein
MIHWYNSRQPMDALTVVVILVVYFVLQTWVLPRFGVPT